MNSDFDITLHSDEASAPGNARDRFLDSFGLGEIPAATPDVAPEVVVENDADDSPDEGVVLSSQPDDLEMPTAESGTGQRTISYSPASSSERTRTVAISITPMGGVTTDEPEAETETIAAQTDSLPDKATNLNESLTLECPECHGELVLQRRHLGIEGLCVWCHTPIIAAESARDAVVRVFPVLGRITKPFAAPAPAPAPVVDEEKTAAAEPAAKVETPAAAPEVLEAPAVEATMPVEVPAENVAPVSEEKIEAPAPESASFSPESFGFGPPVATPAVSMASQPAAKTMMAGIAEAKEEVSPFDLDALYATSSFSRIAPEEDASPSVGFGESMAAPAPTGSPAGEAPANGFGAFLQSSPSGKTAPAQAAVPSAESWSMPAAPAAATPQDAAGFTAATPWGPPSAPAKAATTPVPQPARPVNDEAPVALPIDFASGFGSPAPSSASPATLADKDETGFTGAAWATASEGATPLPLPDAEKPSPVDDFAAAFSSGGFGSVAAVSELGSYTVPGEANPAFAPAPLSNDFAGGFQATGFGVPTPAPAPAAMVEVAPAPQATPDDDFAAAFASAGFESTAPSPASESIDPPPGASGFSSFPDAAPATSLPAVDAVETPDFTFHNSPASKLLFGGEAADEKRSFAMPGHGFSTGSSTEAGEKQALFPDTSATGTETLATGWGISEPIGFSSADDAPVPLSSAPISVSDASPIEESPFGNSPFSALPTPLPAASTETPVSLFAEAAAATESPIPASLPAPAATSVTPPPIPALPRPQEPTFSSIANPIETSVPNVVSEPLGSKSKPKVRKGFIVLMVVIVGFAAGAALASFVLPIDEYVQTARALMEEKFNSGSTVQQIPAFATEAGIAPVTEP